MEFGQPLHAFDFDKIKGSKIIVRRAKSGETVKTIDGQEIKLMPGILVIADIEKPIAVAGVMGGLATEVTQETKNILLESAYFDPILIRRSSRLLGITSESSYRFERGVDFENVLPASNRAVNLIQNITGGGLIDSIEKSSITKAPHRIISLLPNSAENLLGIKIKPQSIKQILTSLQFKLKAKQKSFKVEVPNFRQDIKQEVDLIEEIARIYGFPHLPLTKPPIKISSVKTQPIAKLKDLTRQILISAGFNEIISYSLISRELLSKTNLSDLDLTPIANPLSKEQEILTPSIIPGLLNALNYNLNHGVTNLKLFEINKNYLSAKESYVLGLVMTGEKYIDWLRSKKERIGFFDLKGVIEVFLERLGISRVDFVAESLVVFA
ncbi:MAG: phenylalanine--tRNA ligase subunit beta, partial [bacterium]|nr:phenylalanine--tRNA ligase subunit beta [bacterium]